MLYSFESIEKTVGNNETIKLVLSGAFYSKFSEYDKFFRKKISNLFSIRMEIHSDLLKPSLTRIFILMHSFV